MVEVPVNSRYSIKIVAILSVYNFGGLSVVMPHNDGTVVFLNRKSF